MTRNLESLEIGDSIEIILKKKFKEYTYLSQVLDKLTGDTYVISGPIVRNAFFKIPKETPIKIGYTKKEKGRFYFNATIIQQHIGKIYSLEIRRLSEIIKVQERNYYRLPVVISLIKKHQYEEEQSNKNIVEECITEDISGGGIKFLCNFEHNEGELVVCTFLEELNLAVKGEVIRISESENKNYKYAVGLKFYELTNFQREKLVKYIFKEQRKLRKKGLI